MANETSRTDELMKKWKPLLEHPDLPKITDRYRRVMTASMLEETEKAIASEGHVRGQMLMETPINAVGDMTGNITKFDPVLISLVRRAMPNLIAYDLCGVQPMSGPTGLIFAMRSHYANSSAQGAETFYNEVNTAFSSANSLNGNTNTLGNTQSGNIPGVVNNVGNSTYTTATGMTTASAEGLGLGTSVFPEMAFTIEKLSVTAQSRALKAEYTIELAQDLKAIHGLDAETELSNILSSEILAEINREVVRTINITAVQGATENTTTSGFFDLDVDSNGRWSVEKFKGLMFQIERECNQIAKSTRRGKGNIMVCSADVASALNMAGILDYTPHLDGNNLAVDDTGNTFAGVLNGRIRVYIDPYAGGSNPASGQYMTIGYKGASPFDAGLFYCPYVPLQMVRAVDPNSFQPKIGFKTRYGMVANPYAQGLTQGLGQLVQDTNVYYRRVIVLNLM